MPTGRLRSRPFVPPCPPPAHPESAPADLAEELVCARRRIGGGGCRANPHGEGDQCDAQRNEMAFHGF